MSDNRSIFTHLGHGFGHLANAAGKSVGLPGI